MKKTVSLFLAVVMSVVFLVPCVASASSTVDLLSQEIVYGADVTENTAIKN